MPSSRDLLQRFRPAGTPGQATATGVPADRRAEAEAELRAVFEALEAVAKECESLRRTAKSDADEIRRRGRERALALVANARREAQAEREAIIAQARKDADESSADVMRSAQQKAAEIERAEAARREADVASVVEAVQKRLAALGAAGDQAER